MMIFKRIPLLAILFLLFFAFGCKEIPYTPKPRSFARIDFPEKQYKTFTADYCPLSFEFPSYGSVIKDSLFFNESPEHPCWLDLTLSQFKANIHMSYKEINGDPERFDQLVSDAYKMSFKHSVRADFIDESYFVEADKRGVVYDVGGNAASSVQFFLTDSVNHFFRGSLYFKTQPNIDSLKPVIAFLREDVIHLMESLKWHN